MGQGESSYLSSPSSSCLLGAGIDSSFPPRQLKQMPFAEDIRQLDFPSLTTVTTAHGKVLTEHSNLPTLAQQEAMDAFVDDMDLSEAGGKDEDG